MHVIVIDSWFTFHAIGLFAISLAIIFKGNIKKKEKFRIFLKDFLKMNYYLYFVEFWWNCVIFEK